MNNKKPSNLINIDLKQKTLDEFYQKQKVVTLQFELEHYKHFFEGYKETMLTHLHGAQYVEDIGIYVDRYAPGSARKVSYMHGMTEANNDINKIKTYTLNPETKELT